jgi:clan AA aspartic protease
MGYFKDEEPAMRLEVGSREIEFLVDTGFSGDLLIPDGLANDLDLKNGGALGEFQSVTGQPVPVATYTVQINWLGRRIRKSLATSSEVKEPLLGGGMLTACCLTIDYSHQTVLIDESPL